MDIVNRSLARKEIIMDLLYPLLYDDNEFPVSEEAFTTIVNQCYFLVKNIILNSCRYKTTSKESKLRIDHTLFALREFSPFIRYSFLNRRSETAINKKEIFLRQKITCNGTFKGHWLSIEGVQPITVHNPVDAVRRSAIESTVLKHPPEKRPKCVCDSKVMRVINSLPGYKIKPTDSNLITAEEQLFYTELTKLLVGLNDTKRMEALTSLSSDPVVSSIMPPLVVFISEGTRENIAMCNFPILIYIIRMIHAVVKNPNVYIERYLHELLPCVLSCIVTKEVCSPRDFRNQWALRDFAVSTMRHIVCEFGSEVNQMKARVCKVLEKVVKSQNSSIPACYGATYGLLDLGHDCVNVYLIPHVAYVTDRVTALADSTYPESLERLAADKYIDFFKTKMAEQIMNNVSEENEAEYLRKLGRFGIGVAAYINDQRERFVR